MNLSLRFSNIVIGIGLLISSLLSVIPITIDLIKVGPLNGFNYGFMFLSVLLPLSLMSIAGFMVFFDKEKYFQWIKRILTWMYVLITILLFAFTLMIPPFLLAALLILIPLYAFVKMNKDEMEKYFIFHNSVVMIINLLITTLLTVTIDEYFVKLFSF